MRFYQKGHQDISGPKEPVIFPSECMASYSLLPLYLMEIGRYNVKKIATKMFKNTRLYSEHSQIK